MTDAPDFLALARDVAGSIAARAEPAVGGSRWQTIDYSGQPQYSTDIFAGTTGITIFLADLFAQTGHTAYRDLAEGGAMWVDGQTRAELTAPDRDASLYFGLAGVGIALLRLFEATDRQRWLDAALARARAARRVEFESAEIMRGAAGIGIFLLRAHQATGDRSHLDVAVDVGNSVLDGAKIEDAGWHWPYKRPSGAVGSSTGFVHGAAGIACFLAELFRFTHDSRLGDAVVGAARWIESQALDTPFGPGWGRWPGDNAPPRFQWCHGAPGIGLFAARAYEAIGDRSLLDLALRGGESTYQAGDYRQNPSQCHGLAGSGETLIELARVTGDRRWLRRAREFGRLAAEYREDTLSGPRWRGDEPGNYSPDLMMGSAGAGHFFLRLARPDLVPMPLMVLPGPARG